MSALPPKADIDRARRDVRFVPKADMVRCGQERRYSISRRRAAGLPPGEGDAERLSGLEIDD